MMVRCVRCPCLLPQKAGSQVRRMVELRNGVNTCISAPLLLQQRSCSSNGLSKPNLGTFSFRSVSSRLSCIRSRRFCVNERQAPLGASALVLSVARISVQNAEVLLHSISQIVRGHGPVPLARISTYLTDDVLELLESVEGGLGQFIRERERIFRLDPIVSPSGVRSGFLVSLVLDREGTYRRAGPTAQRLAVSSAASYSQKGEDFILASVLEAMILNSSRWYGVQALYKLLPPVCKQHFCSDAQFNVWLAGKSHWFTLSNSNVTLKRHNEARVFIEKVKFSGGTPNDSSSVSAPQESTLRTASNPLHAPLSPASLPSSSSNKMVFVPPAPSVPHIPDSQAFAKSHSHRRRRPDPHRPAPPSVSPPVQEMMSLRTKRMLGFLQAHVPHTFYLPLACLLSIPGCTLEVLGFNVSKQGSTAAGSPVAVQEYIDAFKKAPSGTLDCRAFGPDPTPHTVFVRLLNTPAVQLLASHKSAEPSASMSSTQHPIQSLMTRTGRKFGDAVFHTFDVLPLCKPILEDFRTFLAKSGPQERRLLARGIHMRDVHQLLSESTIALMRRTLSPHESSKLPDEALILVFDRLRHIFHVDFSASTVSLWCLLPDLEQPSSLSAETTPLPLVLSSIQQLLETEPVDANGIAKMLPASLTWQLSMMFAESSMITKPLTPPTAVLSTAASPTATHVVQFVALHSLYLFFREGSVCTPQLAASLVQANQRHQMKSGSGSPTERQRYVSTVDPEKLTDTDKALMIYERLPKHAVNWDVFKRTEAVADLPFSVANFTTDVFLKHRALFIVYEPLFFKRCILGRVDGIPPPSHLLVPPVHSISDLLRLIALFSAGGIDETTLTRFLSRDAHKMVKRYGGSIELIVRQVPQWFEVQNDLGMQGQAMITYIGATSTSKERK